MSTKLILNLFKSRMVVLNRREKTDVPDVDVAVG
jgi:hypothetical protein